jgi:Ala-tRNA(Pro) deacylase
MGLMNDKENKVQLLIDEDLLREEYIGCHPCINTSTLRIRTQDIIQSLIPAMKHAAKTVCLPGSTEKERT